MTAFSLLLLATISSQAVAPAVASPPGRRDSPRVFLLDGDTLRKNRLRAASRDVTLQPALEQLRRDADQALALAPPSVMDKTLLPESGDKHDYFSYGPYWWPDSSKPKGLPYTRRDGKINPQSRTGTDQRSFVSLCDAVETLGLGYWYLRDDRYAHKAALLARAWFLDPATRMNPNFQHAQAIPGVSAGRGIGLIEARRLAMLNDALALISESSAWTEDDAEAYRTWLETYYRWLTTSANGRDEAKASNNHGTWYDAQTAHLALVLGREDDARKILTRGVTLRLASQIEPDGSQPRELERTKSLSYSMFNLEALFACARLGRRVGVDWWNFQTEDGRSLRQALAYVAPYLDPSKAWPKKDVEPADRTRLLPLLAFYLRHREDQALRALYLAHSPTADPKARWRLVN